MKDIKFPCTMCGACCKVVGKILEEVDDQSILKRKDSPLYFPYEWDKNGRCEKLNDDNTCSVYDNRPVLCNLNNGADILGVSKAEFFNDNIRACNKLMDETGLPEHFRIKEKF